MGKSFAVDILLPMDEYNSGEIYEKDDRLNEIYMRIPEDGKYFKNLRIKSVYSSGEDIRRYIMEKYSLTGEDFKGYSMSYCFGDYHYHLKDGRTIILTESENETLKREHVDDGLYCHVYKHFSADIFSPVANKLIEKGFAAIDDDLINKAVRLIGEEYNIQEETDKEEAIWENVIENIIEYQGNSDGKLIVSLIVGREIAKRVGGLAVAIYD